MTFGSYPLAAGGGPLNGAGALYCTGAGFKLENCWRFSIWPEGYLACSIGVAALIAAALGLNISTVALSSLRMGGATRPSHCLFFSSQRISL